MPSSTKKQARTAKLAGAVKTGGFPKSKAGPAVKKMAKIPMDKLKHFMQVRECLSPEGKGKLLQLLKHFKQLVQEEAGGYGVQTMGVSSPIEPTSLEEDDIDKTERNVIAKTFDTQADFDSYVNQRRGIQMTPKEIEAIRGYTNVKPTQQDKFFVKYETTDDFGNNTTTVIKKLKDGNQFTWTAFSKNETAEEEGKPEGSEEKEEPELKEQEMAQPPQQQDPSGEEMTVNDPIRITKSITFNDETEGSDVLGDFLRKLDI